MVKIVTAVAVLLVGAAFVAPAARADGIAPEADFKATFHLFNEPEKSLTTSGGATVEIMEEKAVYSNDAGHGFLHDVTGRCLAMGTSESRAFHYNGYCTYVDPDGDLIYSTFDIGRAGDQPVKATKAYTGGTGKYTGLTGSADYAVTRLKNLDKDAPSILEGHVQGHYRIQASVAQSDAPR